jgi:hypothetical protein
LQSHEKIGDDTDAASRERGSCSVWASREVRNECDAQRGGDLRCEDPRCEPPNIADA